MMTKLRFSILNLTITSVDDTLSDYEFEAATAYFNDDVAANTYKQLEEVQSHPPAQLLEDDPEVSTSEQVNIQILKGLNAKCWSLKEQFENELEMVREVSGHNCVKDMLTHFRQQSVADSKLCFHLKVNMQLVMVCSEKCTLSFGTVLFPVTARDPLTSRFLSLLPSHKMTLLL